VSHNLKDQGRESAQQLKDRDARGMGQGLEDAGLVCP